MSSVEDFDRVRAQLRHIWAAPEFDQNAWRGTCEILWKILGRDPQKVEDLLETSDP